jgi:hypothetical protein
MQRLLKSAPSPTDVIRMIESRRRVQSPPLRSLASVVQRWAIVLTMVVLAVAVLQAAQTRVDSSRGSSRIADSVPAWASSNQPFWGGDVSVDSFYGRWALPNAT